LDCEERIVKDFSADILYDDSGDEVSEPSILKAEANPNGEQILKKGINIESLRLPPKAIVEKFKPKILQHPSEAARVVEEVLDIPEVSLIYSPFYHSMYVNKKSKEMKHLRIDGVSGEIILTQKASKWETLCPSCGRKITLEERFCGECRAKLLP
ncbi:MAG: zinc ribbon domain-containing protein, partial [Candidatus Bathyarchaeota archaeon]